MEGLLQYLICHLCVYTCLKSFGIQGGTCVLVGDTPSRVAEAAKYAKELIGCDIMESQPYFSQEGHVQVCHRSHMKQNMGKPLTFYTPGGLLNHNGQGALISCWRGA